MLVKYWGREALVRGAVVSLEEDSVPERKNQRHEQFRTLHSSRNLDRGMQPHLQCGEDGESFGRLEGDAATGQHFAFIIIHHDTCRCRRGRLQCMSWQHMREWNGIDWNRVE